MYDSSRLPRQEKDTAVGRAEGKALKLGQLNDKENLCLPIIVAVYFPSY